MATSTNLVHFKRSCETIIPQLRSRNTRDDVRREGLNTLKAKLLAFDIFSATLDSQGANAVRDTLEHAVISSIILEDIAHFNFFYGLLRVFYFDKRVTTNDSTRKYEIMSMHLIHLLETCEFAQFHSVLELVPPSDLASDVFLKYSVLLEQCLMEGNYNRIYLSRDNSPSPFIQFFVDRLILSIRHEIASCVEHSFQTLRYSDAMSILHCDKRDELELIIETRRWTMDEDGTIHFNQRELTEKRLQEQSHIDYKRYVLQFLDYTRAIEAII